MKKDEERQNEEPNYLSICIITGANLGEKLDAGGIRCLSIAKSLAKLGNQVILVCSNEELKFEIEQKHRIIFYKLPYINMRVMHSLIFIISCKLILRYIIKKHDIKVIHAVNPYCGFISTFYKKIFKSPIVFYDVLGIVHEEQKIGVHQGVWRRINNQLLKFCHLFSLRNTDAVITVNNAHKKILENCTNKHIYVMRDGIDTLKFNHTRVENVNLQIKKSDEVMLTHIGSLTHNRLKMLFNIIPIIVRKIPGLKILIIGSGPDYNRYIKKSSELGILNKNIYFIGYVSHDEIPKYLKISDICYSDIWSTIGFPMKVFEYMAMGKAVVVEDTVAAREILTDGMNALLYKDEKDLLEKIILLAKDRNLREELGRNAKKVMKEHTWKKRGEEIAHIYKAYTPKHNGRS